MEEKKNNAQVVGMNNAGGKHQQAGDEQPQKLTYEQLNQVCMELSQQNQQMNQYIGNLRKQIQEMASVIQAKRMDYLFKVVTLYAEHQMFDEKFVGDCIAEIEQTLTIPVEEEQPEEKKDSED